MASYCTVRRRLRADECEQMLQHDAERVAVPATVTDRRPDREWRRSEGGSRRSDGLSHRAHRSPRRANRRYATFRRARELFSAFRVEQTDPDRFYGLMARDSAAQLELFVPLAGKTLLDIGGGPGYFADAFRCAGSALPGRRRRPRRAQRQERARARHRPGQRDGSAVREQRRGRLLLEQRPGTRRSDRGGWPRRCSG